MSTRKTVKQLKTTTRLIREGSKNHSWNFLNGLYQFVFCAGEHCTSQLRRGSMLLLWKQLCAPLYTLPEHLCTQHVLCARASNANTLRLVSRKSHFQRLSHFFKSTYCQLFFLQSFNFFPLWTAWFTKKLKMFICLILIKHTGFFLNANAYIFISFSFKNLN